MQMLKLGQAGGSADVESTPLFEFFCKIPCDECVLPTDPTSRNSQKSGIFLDRLMILYQIDDSADFGEFRQ